MQHYLITIEQAIAEKDPDTGEVLSVSEYINAKKTSDDEQTAITNWHTRCAELANAIGKTTVYSECRLVNSVFGNLRDDVFGTFFVPPAPEPEPEPEE